MCKWSGPGSGMWKEWMSNVCKNSDAIDSKLKQLGGKPRFLWKSCVKVALYY